MSIHAPYQSGLPAPKCYGTCGEIGQGEPGYDQDGGLFVIFWVNVHQYKLKLYAKDTYHNYLKSPELASPRKVYFCVKSSF